MVRRAGRLEATLGALSLCVVAVAMAGREVTDSRGTFAPDRMSTVLYGAAYYPEYTPYDRLDADVELM